ncbi:hypothetical protein NJL88_29155 [Streptomyces sp. DK15]|nr:hypothetical protein [Streptomyces sp. DK15]
MAARRGRRDHRRRAPRRRHRHWRTPRTTHPLTHSPTRVLLDAERAALAGLEGGCLTAASAHATLDGTGRVTVHVAVLDPTGGPALYADASGPAERAAGIGLNAARTLLDAGAAHLLAVIPD